jgi:hypothetical protein
MADDPSGAPDNVAHAVVDPMLEGRACTMLLCVRSPPVATLTSGKSITLAGW